MKCLVVIAEAERDRGLIDVAAALAGENGEIIAASVIGMSVSGTRSSVFILVVGLVMLQFGLRSARRSFAFLLIALLAIWLVIANTTPMGLAMPTLLLWAWAGIARGGRSAPSRERTEQARPHEASSPSGRELPALVAR